MDLFTAYQEINNLYESENGNKDEERQKLIQVLDEHQKK